MHQQKHSKAVVFASKPQTANTWIDLIRCGVVLRDIIMVPFQQLYKELFWNYLYFPYCNIVGTSVQEVRQV